MSGNIFSPGIDHNHPVQPAFILLQAFISRNEFLSVVASFISNKGPSFSDKRKAPSGKLIKTGDRSRNAHIIRAAEFRLLLDLFGASVYSCDIADSQSLSKFINNSQSLLS